MVSAEEQAKLSSDASLDEEIDALEQDLTQEGEESVSEEVRGASSTNSPRSGWPR